MKQDEHERSKQRTSYIDETPKNKLLHLVHQSTNKDTTQRQTSHNIIDFKR